MVTSPRLPAKPPGQTGHGDNYRSLPYAENQLHILTWLARPVFGSKILQPWYSAFGGV